ATLSVSDNASNSPQTASLSGTGTSTPSATLSPTSLSFGNQQEIGRARAGKERASNTGRSTGTINSIGITGTNSGDFAQTNNCGTSPASNSRCTTYGTLTPAASASRSATLSVSDNASNSPQTASLSGTGTSTPSATLSPTSLSFGNQQ